jgi:hypothetical protein
MKAYLIDYVRTLPTPAHGRNVAREYLQARILGCLQRAGAMIPLAFHGGTALRFLYATPRYSEDLDFALERARSQYDFRAYLRAIRAELAGEGYTGERSCGIGWRRWRGIELWWMCVLFWRLKGRRGS